MQLRATFAELGMPSIPSIYPMPNVQDQFDDDGNARDPAHVRRVGRFLDELVRTDLMSAVSSVSRVAVLGTLTRGEGPAIGLRADMDALGFEEANDFAHRSTRRGKMHACGHDGHTAMLLGAARYLAETRRFRGSVHFIFQPAEENEAGGRVMVEQGLFEKFPVDAVYGMHNYPGLAVGRMALMAGPMMAACDQFEITVFGRGCHAAMPHLGSDVVLAASTIITSLHTLVGRIVDPQRAGVVSVTQVACRRNPERHPGTRDVTRHRPHL